MVAGYPNSLFISFSLRQIYMFTLGFLIGLLAYTILILGKLSSLTFFPILLSTIFYSSLLFFWLKSRYKEKPPKFPKLSKIEWLIFILIIIFSIIHLIGALAPEIFYDALWYHLTLPKLYLARQKIFFIPGNLLYYSAMPSLGEILYTIALALGNEITAKILHLSFGLLTTFLIYQFGAKIFNKKVGLIASLVFISDLAFSWQATTAYIDLIRTFFEFSTFYFFYLWQKTKDDLNLYKAGILGGFALSTKYQAIGSIIIFTILTFFYSKDQKVRRIFKFLFPVGLFSGYWFINAFFQTGNPIYPIFSGILSDMHQFKIPYLINFFTDFFALSNMPSDWTSPISPIYLILLPLAIYLTFKIKKIRPLAIFSLLAYVYWFLTPKTGGSRFILPYLPVFAIFVSSIFCETKENKIPKLIQNFSLLLIIFISLIHLSLRAYINKKAIPVILGTKTKQQFLLENLDLTHAFLDTDEYFKNNIGKNDNVLIIGGQNLYYVDFPFTHESFEEYQKYNFIMTQYVNLPVRFGNLKPIYENQKTKVKLYRL